MQNVFEEYSLSEVCADTGLSTAWVKRVEQKLGLSGSSGQRGKKSVYTKEFVETLRNFRFLQACGFEIKTIEKLWEVEKELSKLDVGKERYKLLHERPGLSENDNLYEIFSLLKHSPYKDEFSRNVIVVDVKDFNNSKRKELLVIHHKAMKKVAENEMLAKGLSEMIEHARASIKTPDSRDPQNGDWTGNLESDLIKAIGKK